MLVHMLVSTEVAEKLTDNLAGEHTCYYGKPHGYTPIDYNTLEKGLSRKEAPTHCGFTPTDRGGIWVRRYGSWVMVDEVKGCVTLGGRRQALLEYSRWLRDEGCYRYVYERTRRPDLAPWEHVSPEDHNLCDPPTIGELIEMTEYRKEVVPRCSW